MSKIRILFSSWYVGLGGGETDLLTLEQTLDLDRYEPHLLIPYEGQLGEHWRAMGFPVHIVPFRGASIYFIPSIWGRLPSVSRMESVLRDKNIQLVHTNYHSLPMMASAARRVGIPIMWTVHGWWFKPKFWQRDFFRSLTAVGRSYAIRDGFLGNPPFMPKESIPVVYSGIDTQRFHPEVSGVKVRFDHNIPQDAPLVVMVARFQKVKGHHTFQAMAQQVALQIPTARFIVAGENVFGVAKDDAYKQEMLNNLETNRLLRSRMKYIGFREDVEHVLASADVVVCASEFESYGKVNLEAMATGKPVVSTNRGGPSETVIDGETGYLVDSGDAEALAKHVIHLLRDTELRDRLGKAGRARVLQHFSAESTATAYMSIFERLIKSDKPY